MRYTQQKLDHIASILESHPYRDLFNKMIDDLIQNFEGGYVNDPDDLGGETNYGITASVAKAFGYDGSMRDLPLDTAEFIYKVLYLYKPGIYLIPDSNLMRLVFDSQVQHGSRAVKWLQELINTKQDGIIGKKTIRRLDEYDMTNLYLSYITKRIRFYGYIISKRHQNAKFAYGWAKRVTTFLFDVPGLTDN